MNQTQIFWDDGNPVARILLIGTLGYIALALLLRVSGARTGFPSSQKNWVWFTGATFRWGADCGHRRGYPATPQAHEPERGGACRGGRPGREHRDP